jgi:hypothetical protein
MAWVDDLLFNYRLIITQNVKKIKPELLKFKDFGIVPAVVEYVLLCDARVFSK